VIRFGGGSSGTGLRNWKIGKLGRSFVDIGADWNLVGAQKLRENGPT